MWCVAVSWYFHFILHMKFKAVNEWIFVAIIILLCRLLNNSKFLQILIFIYFHHGTTMNFTSIWKKLKISVIVLHLILFRNVRCIWQILFSYKWISISISNFSLYFRKIDQFYCFFLLLLHSWIFALNHIFTFSENDS